MSIRDDILAGLRIAEAGSVGDETPEELLARYDALKRREVLAEAADAVAEEIADGEHDPDCLVDHIRYLASLKAGESRG